MEHSFVIVVVVAALVFDYINGFHDAANSIATVVSTRACCRRGKGGRGRRSSTSRPSSPGTAVAKTMGAGMIRHHAGHRAGSFSAA
ncbi:MAG: hypothetical protein R2708_27565 [Vicinamibacterales bacterium]